MKTFATLLAFAAMMMAAPLSAQTKTETVEGLYTVEIPQDWIAASAAKSVFVFTNISTPDASAMISINATKTPMALKQGYKTMVEAVSKNKSYSGYSVIGEGESAIGGQPCKWICCSYTVSGIAMKGKQYVLRNGNRLYYIQYHLSADVFDSYTAQFEEIIATISFK